MTSAAVRVYQQDNHEQVGAQAFLRCEVSIVFVSKQEKGAKEQKPFYVVLLLCFTCGTQVI